MRKKTFVALVLGAIGGLLFSLGMCMALVTEWNTFQEGVICGGIGTIILAITWFLCRKMSGKKMKKVNMKIVGKIIYGIFAALVLGVGMCLIMVYEKMILGIIVGIVGIVLLLFLIPMCIGWKKEEEEEKEKNKNE